jgi:fructoselysine transporter
LQANTPKLERGLSLWQATAINMIDMVGIGPFVTMSIIVGFMNGPASIIAWLLGAALAYADGMVWAEMGARWPQAGGSYVFLQKLFGEKKGGRLMSFLFIWQTTLQAPLVIASGAIGFSDYFSFLMPLTDIQKKMVSGGLVILLVALLYRNIKSIGKISVVLWVITGGSILWLILSGVPHFNAAQAFNINFDGFKTSSLLYAAIGHASLKSVYSYLGYYNVCHLGGEIKHPEKNIARSILISITGIAILYLAMQTVILGVIPWQTVKDSKFVASIYFEHIYNHTTAVVATVLILIIALSSLFSAILGYSRIPYAAALNGDFFSIFAKVHPKHHFPHISLLAVGGVGFIFSLLFRLGDVITAILTMRILVQFVSQAVGIIAWNYNHKGEDRPYKMPLFPVPAILSIIIWLFIYSCIDWHFIVGSLGIISLGIVAYFTREHYMTSKK